MIEVDNVRLPEDVERGAQVGPMFRTSIIGLSSGRENSNQDWQEDLIVADISYGIMPDRGASPDDIEEGFMRIHDFFLLRRGRHRGFLFRNPLDNVGNREPLYGIPSKARALQISKTWSDAATSYRKRITRPDPATLTLYAGNSIIPPGGGSGVPAWSLSPLGVIEFVADIPPAVYTASFEYDVPMRFETDNLRVQLEHLKAGEIPEITIQQIRE